MSRTCFSILRKCYAFRWDNWVVSIVINEINENGEEMAKTTPNEILQCAGMVVCCAAFRVNRKSRVSERTSHPTNQFIQIRICVHFFTAVAVASLLKIRVIFLTNRLFCHCNRMSLYMLLFTSYACIYCKWKERIRTQIYISFTLFHHFFSVVRSPTNIYHGFLLSALHMYEN